MLVTTASCFQVHAFKLLFSPLIAVLLYLWSYLILLPVLKTQHIFKDWLQESRQSTPTNRTNLERQSTFSIDADEIDNFRVSH